MNPRLTIINIVLLAVMAFALRGGTANAQSSDQSLPTPVLSNEISGKIVALDLGDPRLSRHFYAFEGTPGDLLITVNSRNLNGDVDVFTAVTFKPLMKISVYANTIPPEVTKSLYFRTPQILILRVEARTPNDDPGEYRITFGGTFKAFSGGIPVAEASESSAETAKETARNTRRLSSVGATIEQPPAEIKPEETKPPEIVAETPPEEKPVVTKPAPRPRSPARSTRNRPGRTPRPPPAKIEPAKPETAKTETPATEEKKSAAEEEKPPEKPASETPAQETAGTRLIIEKVDGTRIDRPMSTVRRVVIEGSVIVVVLKTGRIERIPMSLVTRMAIEP
jgi:hypothetical protein